MAVDVGANVGQWAMNLRRSGYTGRILSVEPLATAFRSLQRAAEGDPDWSVLQAAVGAVDGTATLHISKNSVSSSILEIQESHLDASPQSRVIAEEATVVRRLDSILQEHLDPGTRTFLKLDVQGFESHVLNGASKSLDSAMGLEIELSLVDLYAGQATYLDLISRISLLGFEPWHLEPVFTDPVTGRTLQVDGLFFRRD
ncbi:FkbM family methyltransferase [Agromyces sp. MMS24-JH15]|uniref:FkbM family methyltransferase n=1 Tax=Agromyces sp. MMS24-JH15 TaxID=3243765 RepID=UPI00374A6713